MKLYNYLKNKLLNILSKNLYGWKIYISFDKLSYNFNSLYYGIKINQSAPNYFNFRRNIHRLEKGLSFNIKKNTFAESYIFETVYYLKSHIQLIDEKTKYWGISVINKYFKVCENTPIIKKSLAIFHEINLNGLSLNQVPYLETERVKNIIKFDDFKMLLKRRRSIRSFENRLPEIEYIKEVLVASIEMPSACNRQAYRFIIISNKDLLEKASEILGGLTGYSVPLLTFVIGQYRAYFDERDIFVPIIDSIFSVSAFTLGLETKGLSSVIINWANIPFKEKSIRKLLKIEKDEIIITCIGIGYPKKTAIIPFSSKRNINDMLTIIP